jgi:hypothetical protein
MIPTRTMLFPTFLNQGRFLPLTFFCQYTTGKIQTKGASFALSGFAAQTNLAKKGAVHVV